MGGALSTGPGSMGTDTLGDVASVGASNAGGVAFGGVSAKAGVPIISGAPSPSSIATAKAAHVLFDLMMPLLMVEFVSN